jgi:signal peptidase II
VKLEGLPRKKIIGAQCIWFGVAGMIAMLDQISKGFFIDFLSEKSSYLVFPGFNLQLAYNKGIAFSLGHQSAFPVGVAILTVNIVLSIVIAHWLYRAQNSLIEKVALTAILGGALGNLWDRLHLGKVVDFIDVYWQQWHWPTFNLADSFITLGVCLYLYWLFFNTTSTDEKKS